MKLAIIVMLISLLMSVVIDLYNVYDMNKRLKRLEISLAEIQLRLAMGKNNAIESFTKVVAGIGGKMEDNLTLKDKLKEIQDLSSRKSKIETLLHSCEHRMLELIANDYTRVYLAREEKLNELVHKYLKTELEKVDKKLNELLK